MRVRAISSVRVTLVTILSVVFAVFPLVASQPASGSLSATGSSVTFTGSALGGASPEAETTCVEGVNCDTFTLTLSGTPADWNGKNVRVSLSWLLVATDYDMYVHKDSATGTVVASSALGTTTAEGADINVAQSGTGTYVVHVVYFAAAGDQYKGRAEVVSAQSDTPPPTSPGAPPSFTNYAAPA